MNFNSMTLALCSAASSASTLVMASAPGRPFMASRISSKISSPECDSGRSDDGSGCVLFEYDGYDFIGQGFAKLPSRCIEGHKAVIVVIHLFESIERATMQGDVPTFRNDEKLARALKISLSELFRGVN